MARNTDDDDTQKLWEKVHDVDTRVTVLETKMTSTENLVESINDKHSQMNSSLERLTVLFERFLANFERHVEEVDKRQVLHESKLEKAATFQSQIRTIWKTLATVTIITATVFGAVYTFSNDIGLLPHISQKQ